MNDKEIIKRLKLSLAYSATKTDMYGRDDLNNFMIMEQDLTYFVTEDATGEMVCMDEEVEE